MKAFLVLPFALLLGAAAAPDEVQTGRSVAVAKAPQTYWLSDDLNRLFLQKPAHDLNTGGRADR